jgi:signal transduction histidine kinase
MAPSPDNAALVILCSPNGTSIEVLYDELGLRFGRHFDSIVAAPDRRKARRFLKTVLAAKAALDWELRIALAGRVVPLFFSASVAGRGIAIIATKAPFATETVHRGAARMREVDMSILTPAIDRLRAREDAKNRSIHRARSQMKRLNHRVRGIQRDLAADLDAQKANLVQILRAFAHDLRNPISGILAASQYLVEDAGHLLERHQMKLLQSIESSSKVALQFIEDMLALHSVEPGKLKLEIQRTDIVKLVAETAGIHRPLAESRGVVLDIKTQGASPILNLDARRMAHAISALLRTALGYLRSGSSVEILVVESADGVAITVGGEKIHTAAAEIKTPAKKRSGTPSAGGFNEVRTALTLAAVQRIIEAHDGEIHAEGFARGEPTVTVILPRSARKGAAARRGTKTPHQVRHASGPEHST